MNIYKEVRQLRQKGRSQRSIATQLGISRNTVKKYWDGEAVPWVRKEYQRPTSVLAEGVKDFMQHCLEEDEENGLRKQSHTAKRIYDRLVEEHRASLAASPPCDAMYKSYVAPPLRSLCHWHLKQVMRFKSTRARQLFGWLV